MRRPSKREIDDDIVETAAALFARHGFAQTSLQRVADAVGYSKTGLLHRFPTKDALEMAAVTRCLELVERIADEVRTRPVGPNRDHAVLTAVVDIALQQPGYVALMLGVFGADPGGELGQHMQDVGDGLFAAFAASPTADLQRSIELIGALGALAVASLACRDQPPDLIRPHLVAMSYAALGHPAPAPSEAEPALRST